MFHVERPTLIDLMEQDTSRHGGKGTKNRILTKTPDRWAKRYEDNEDRIRTTEHDGDAASGYLPTDMHLA